MVDDCGDDDWPNEIGLGDYPISCACCDLGRFQSRLKRLTRRGWLLVKGLLA